jgi:hypothetical protein
MRRLIGWSFAEVLLLAIPSYSPLGNSAAFLILPKAPATGSAIITLSRWSDFVNVVSTYSLSGD